MYSFSRQSCKGISGELFSSHVEKRSTLTVHLPFLKPLTLTLKNPIYQTPIYHLSSIQKICLKWSNTNLFSYTEVSFFKLWNGWNRRTHGDSST
ncbi:hypothetical protein HanIR_Chr01g0026621 [Helianthus annuus]|nr:hypothetical protein HanIR_Chr01g0026621 [Helianthus annuus]